jgi:hypothetical protein
MLRVFADSSMRALPGTINKIAAASRQIDAAKDPVFAVAVARQMKDEGCKEKSGFWKC